MKTRITFISLALSVLIVGGIVGGCGNRTGNNKTASTGQVAGGVLQVDDVLAGVDGTVGETVKVEGVCTHICKHGGRKIFLMGSDDTKSIRIEAGEVIGAFKQECVNSVVEVEGVLREQRIDEAYLARWEEQVKASTAGQHGDGEEGCSADQVAKGEIAAGSTMERIGNFRKRIAERSEKEGKDYLSFYYIDAASYQIM